MTAEQSDIRVVERDGLDEAFVAALIEMAARSANDSAGAEAKHLRAIARFLPIVVAVADANGIYTACYGGVLDAKGISEQEFIGQDVGLFGPNSRMQFDRVMQEGPLSSLVEGDTDGVKWAFSVAAVPLPDGQGVLSIAVDLCDSDRAAQLALEHDLLFRTTINGLD